jgi:arabinogalactan oligomer / maltooligosaccharide transport system permease protein
MSTQGTANPGREDSSSRPAGPAGFIVRLVLVGLVDALLIWALATAATAQWWLAVGFFAFALVAINVVYLTKRFLPLKFLLPGVLFLIVFQLYTMAFTAFSSFTNYGTGHLDDKPAAIVAIQGASVVPVEGGREYQVVPVVQDGVVSMLIVDPDTGEVSVGTNEAVTPVPPDQVIRDGDRVTGVQGYESLNLGTLSQNADYTAQWESLQPPLDAGAGSYLRPISVTRATEARPGFVYDEAQDAMIDSATGEVFPADETVGNFVSATTGEVLFPGWLVQVGLQNYLSLLTDEGLRSAFLPITIWTFFFAFATTFLNFSLGLMLALVLSERRMGGQGIYRLLLIVPYGLPALLMTLVWKGMLNTDFGVINSVLGQQIPWLTDPWLARFSVLAVNLWLGFPYFFLVCSGALTAIPIDKKEAAYVDGASGRYTFRSVVLPLLLVATAPLLVTTFAFNFNNYTLIELLTGGGPFPGSTIDGGSTDLLINFTYRQAFNTSFQQLGLASAIAMLIFVVVGTVSAYGFRLTKRLEEIGT